MRRLAAVLFPNFELLDLAGPLEMFGNLKQEIEIATVAQVAGAVASVQGVSLTAEYSFEDLPGAEPPRTRPTLGPVPPKAQQ